MTTAYTSRSTRFANGAAGRSTSLRLAAEWQRLSRSAAVLATVRSWGLTDEPFGDLDQLLALAGFGGEATAATDEVLVRLMRRANDGGLAARIVLQRILPGLLSVAAVEQRREPGLDALEELVADAWVAILRYRVDRRPTAIAARLINDARHLAFTDPRRRCRFDEAALTPDIDPEPGPPSPHAFEELTTVLVDARRSGLADDDLAFVRLLVDHDTVDAAAAARRVSSRTIRTRRREVTERIRALVSPQPVLAAI